MTCPTCQSATRIIDTTPSGQETRRRHQCRNGHRFATVETVVGMIEDRVCSHTGLFGFANKYYAMRKRRNKSVATAKLCEHCNKWHLTLALEPAKPHSEI